MRRRAPLLFGFAIALAACEPSRVELPARMLWAWERPEHLGFLAGQRDVGVVPLVGTVHVDGTQVRGVPRLQPIELPPDVMLLPLVRVEIGVSPAPLDEAQATAVARQIVRLARHVRADALQLELESRRSERPFHRRVVAEVRRLVGPRAFLSMTALGSWCAGDAWLDDLPVDEIVPMLYRLGADGPALRARVAARDLPAAACRHAVGLTSDEPPVAPPPDGWHRRIYAFHPRAWSAQAYTELLTNPSLRPKP